MLITPASVEYTYLIDQVIYVCTAFKKDVSYSGYVGFLRE